MNNGLEMRPNFLLTHSMKLGKKCDIRHLPHYALLAHYFWLITYLMKVTKKRVQIYSIRSNKRAINKNLL